MEFHLNNGDEVLISPQQRDYISVGANKRIYNKHSSNVSIYIDGVQARVLPFSDDIEIRQGATTNNYVAYNYNNVVWRKGTFSQNTLISCILIFLAFSVFIKCWRSA